MTNVEPSPEKLSGDIAETKRTLKHIFSNCSDVVFRTMSISQDCRVLVVYIDGLVDSARLEEVTFSPQACNSPVEIPAAHVKETAKLDMCVNGILSGQALIVYEQAKAAFLIDVVK